MKAWQSVFACRKSRMLCISTAFSGGGGTVSSQRAGDMPAITNKMGKANLSMCIPHLEGPSLHQKHDFFDRYALLPCKCKKKKAGQTPAFPNPIPANDLVPVFGRF
ncbi:hypothetical protein ACQZ6F_15410 [Rhizobium sp. A22-96]